MRYRRGVRDEVNLARLRWALCAGRMLIGQGAIDAAKIGVSIALRYACARPQFQGKRIMEYRTHQRRLLPALATTYAMQLQSLRLKVLPDVPLIMHATMYLVALLDAPLVWHEPWLCLSQNIAQCHPNIAVWLPMSMLPGQNAVSLSCRRCTCGSGQRMGSRST